MLKQRVIDGKARSRQAEPEIIMPAIRFPEPVASREGSGSPLRLAAQSFLILAVIVGMTFALLVVMDYVGIHLAPTGDMLAAD